MHLHCISVRSAVLVEDITFFSRFILYGPVIWVAPLVFFKLNVILLFQLGVVDSETWPAHSHRWHTHLHKWSTIPVAASRWIRWMDAKNKLTATPRQWHLWVSGFFGTENQYWLSLSRNWWVYFWFWFDYLHCILGELNEHDEKPNGIIVMNHLVKGI